MFRPSMASMRKISFPRTKSPTKNQSGALPHKHPASPLRASSAVRPEASSETTATSPPISAPDELHLLRQSPAEFSIPCTSTRLMNAATALQDPAAALPRLLDPHERSVSVVSPGFRSFIRKELSLPAYIGVVLFARVLAVREARDFFTHKLIAAEQAGTSPTSTSMLLTQSSTHSADELLHCSRTLTNNILLQCRRLAASNSAPLVISAEDLVLGLGPEFGSLTEPADKLLLLLTSALSFELSSTGHISVRYHRQRTGFLQLRQLRPVIEALIDRHPCLDEYGIRGSPELRQGYTQYVLASIAASLHGLGSGRISLHEIRRSNFVAALQYCGVPDLNAVAPFGPKFFLGTWQTWKSKTREQSTLCVDVFVAIQRMPARSYSTPDSHGNDVSALHLRHTAAIQDHILERVAANAPGVLNGVELGLVEPAISTPAAASATASEASVCWDCGQSHSSHPTLDFQQYLWFIEAMQDQMSDQSILYWIRCLDADGDDQLSQFDLTAAIQDTCRLLATDVEVPGDEEPRPMTNSSSPPTSPPRNSRRVLSSQTSAPTNRSAWTDPAKMAIHVSDIVGIVPSVRSRGVLSACSLRSAKVGAMLYTVLVGQLK